MKPLKVQALELKGDLGGAYMDAKRLFTMDKSNKAIQQMVMRLRDRVELTHIEQRSTENRVTKMFDIAFDTKLNDPEKKKTALNNIIYLSRDEAGAERIFQEGGLEALKELIAKDDEFALPAIRALDGVLGEHKARCHQALRIIGHQRLRELLASPTEDLSNATMSTTHRIVQSLKTDKVVNVRHMDETILPEIGPDLTLFFNMFIEMLLDKTVSAPGRDNVLTLLAKNVPRDMSIKGATNERVLKFMELKGIERLLSLASRTYSVDKSPVPISPNTRANVAVCLSTFYDDMGGDQARLEYTTRAEKYMKGLFAEVTMETNMRAMAVVTTCLQGPFDVGYRLLGTAGVMESMIAMSSAEDEEVQKTAIEAILSCINKASNVTFVVENGTTLLKEIYKKTKNDSVKVRALVGLCKLGASHGTDVSRRVFAEGKFLLHL